MCLYQGPEAHQKLFLERHIISDADGMAFLQNPRDLGGNCLTWAGLELDTASLSITVTADTMKTVIKDDPHNCFHCSLDLLQVSVLHASSGHSASPDIWTATITLLSSLEWRIQDAMICLA